MGLLNPKYLAWGASLAILVLIYLRSRSQPTIEVSSLMLFEEAPAPVTRVRLIRVDSLFWLEMAALSALTLAIAGLYVRMPEGPGHGHSHALIFDVGAGMSARQGSGTRLDAARREAESLISLAPPDDEFSVVDYALDARLLEPQTANRDSIRNALAALHPLALPARAAALRAALMRARGASEVDVFADRALEGTIDEGGTGSHMRFHRVGTPADNLAIVSLDPGLPGITGGHVAIRNISERPHLCELAVDLGTTEVTHQSLMLAPREQILVPFPPLSRGGLVHARILTADAIEADNSRYAWAVSNSAARALVLSPDPEVRDDLARVLLAVNGNFQVETADPTRYRVDKNAPQFALVVVHDSDPPPISAASTLAIYPRPDSHRASDAHAGFVVAGSLPGAEMHEGANPSTSTDSVVLGRTRVLTLADWMQPVATARSGERGPLPAAALGRGPAGLVGVLAFDVRNHFLLDPDHLDALVVAVDVVKRLAGPSGLEIVNTGSYVSIPASGEVRVTDPSGRSREQTADQSGRVRVRAIDSGRYTLESGSSKFEVLANYYDAAESDVTAPTVSKRGQELRPRATTSAAPRVVRPLTTILVAMVLIAMLAESILLARKAPRWGIGHV